MLYFDYLKDETPRAPTFDVFFNCFLSYPSALRCLVE